MNLILLSAAEAAAQPVLLTGARATHLLGVLKVHRGQQVRVGIVDGPLGTATVEDLDDEQVTLACEFEHRIPPRSEDVLLLAVPRPVVLRRCLAAAAALGFGQIVLFRSWRVDKSHLAAGVLDDREIHRHLVAGLAQARRTRLPAVRLHPLFKPFVEDHLDLLAPTANRFVAHPDAATELAAAPIQPAAPYTLALGPERGFIDYEVQALAMLGFTPVRAGRHPLRVETALAYVTGQLELRRSHTATPGSG